MQDSPSYHDSSGDYQPTPKYKWHWLIILLFVIVASGAIIFTKFLKTASAKMAANPERPRILAGVKPFKFVERSGREFSTRELLGKITIAQYLYTSCPGACITSTAGLRQLQAELRRDGIDIHILCVSLDPENDSPARMQSFAESHGVDRSDWFFVSGDDKNMRELMISNLGLAAPQANTDPAVRAVDGPFSHDGRVVLIDQQMQARGTLYDLWNSQGFIAEAHRERINADIRWLAAHPEE